MLTATYKRSDAAVAQTQVAMYRVDDSTAARFEMEPVDGFRPAGAGAELAVWVQDALGPAVDAAWRRSQVMSSRQWTKPSLPSGSAQLYMSLGAAVGSDFPAVPTQLSQSLARLAHQLAFGRKAREVIGPDQHESSQNATERLPGER
jgi:hypothetical protein